MQAWGNAPGESSYQNGRWKRLNAACEATRSSGIAPMMNRRLRNESRFQRWTF